MCAGMDIFLCSLLCSVSSYRFMYFRFEDIFSLPQILFYPTTFLGPLMGSPLLSTQILEALSGHCVLESAFSVFLKLGTLHCVLKFVQDPLPSPPHRTKSTP